MQTVEPPVDQLDVDEADADGTESAEAAPVASGRTVPLVRRMAMRPRRSLVVLHRWLGIGIFLWICVIGLTGAWLVESNAFESWIHPGRYEHTPGDVGPSAALAAAKEAVPDDANVYGLSRPGNNRGVYVVWAEIPPPDGAAEGAEPGYRAVYVDPGTGTVNGVEDDGAGLTAWLYRGHEFLWQDHGVFGAFDPETGFCKADRGGHEPGGVKGIVCDVLPDGMDLVGWFAVGFIVLLLGGFYLWYWPGVRRWATAFVVKRGRGRFNLHLSLHRVIGFVFWIPLTVVAFTGAAFAFPNMSSWYENATPAQRDLSLWTPTDEVTSEDAAGREPIGLDRALEIVETRYPDREVHYMGNPADETGYYDMWVTRGFDPWTRQGGAGNVYVFVDQYSGKVLYDGTPEDGNVFDQAWDDWSFPLHTGDFGGPVTRVLWVAVGLSPIVLGVTGIVMQLVRRSKRKRRRSAAKVTAPVSSPS
jgi:uncharacterized iron-regulated membrane protein